MSSAERLSARRLPSARRRGVRPPALTSRSIWPRPWPPIQRSRRADAADRARTAADRARTAADAAASGATRAARTRTTDPCARAATAAARAAAAGARTAARAGSRADPSTASAGADAITVPAPAEPGTTDPAARVLDRRARVEEVDESSEQTERAQLS